MNLTRTCLVVTRLGILFHAITRVLATKAKGTAGAFTLTVLARKSRRTGAGAIYRMTGTAVLAFAVKATFVAILIRWAGSVTG